MNFDNSFVVGNNGCSALVCIMFQGHIPPRCESLYLPMAVEGLPSDIDRLTLSVYMGLECVLRRVASLNVQLVGYDFDNSFYGRVSNDLYA